nr:sigma-70 family RNA polymerase sigma factor [Aeoliella straminimaris]
MDNGQDRRATEIVDLIENGDHDAVAVLMERFGPWLEKAIDRKIGAKLSRRIDAEDIVQSTFWSFVKRTSNSEYQFEHTGALCRLLLTIADNKLQRTIRKEFAQKRDIRREATRDAASVDLADDIWRRTADDLADAVDEVAAVVDEFSDRDAEIFRRHYFLGKSTAQISTELGWSLATVKRRLKWAVAEIRGRLQTDTDQETGGE